MKALIARLAKLKKPMAAILFNGRPLELTGWLDQVSAVIEAWYPGSEAGSALADVIFGDYNPSGRLSMNFPYTVGQIPVYYDHYSTGRPRDLKPEESRYVSRYLDAPNEPLFPFGYGLSYTTYEFSGLRLSSRTLSPSQSVIASLEVKNTGDREGLETIQHYIRDHFAAAVRPLKELKGRRQIKLLPNEKNGQH